MADNSFRNFRRDSLARSAQPAQHDGFADPLAELARLIGQNEPHGGQGRDPGQLAGAFNDAPLPSELDWAASGDDYAHSDPEEGRAASRPAEPEYPHPSGEARWPAAAGYDDELARASQYAHEGRYADEVAGDRRYAHPANALDDGRGDPRRSGNPQDLHYPDEPRPLPARAEPLPYVPPPQSRTYADEQDRLGPQAPRYADDSIEYGDDDYDDAAPRPRRSGTIVIIAVLGLAVLGTAGALGYRAMFGGPMIPSLPPIIKPGDTPIKIVPKHDAQTGTPSEAAAGTAGTGEQVVSHEEQPVDVQSANPVPRVVTTIPVISDAPDAPLPGTQPLGAPGQAVAAPSAPAVPPPALAEPNNVAPSSGTPGQLTAMPPAPSPAESRSVRTLTIRPGEPTAANAAEPAPAPEVKTTNPRPPATRSVRESARERVREAAPRTVSGGPLSIVPTQEARAPRPAPLRTAMERPAPMSLTSRPGEAAPSARGGYAVQVTSRRSEAEAQAAFRTLQAKYPRQLGGHRAFFRRADLGAKGVYYRALVGPFASSEQAISLCSSLKAAGGSCLIQRN